jgi:hypothetical protein
MLCSDPKSKHRTIGCPESIHQFGVPNSFHLHSKGNRSVLDKCFVHSHQSPRVSRRSPAAPAAPSPVCGLEGLGVVFLRISEMEAESQFSNSESRKKRKKECQVFLAEEVMHEDQEGVGGIRECGTVAEATATALAEEVGVETTMEVVVRIAVVVVAVVVAREETQTKQMRV